MVEQLEMMNQAALGHGRNVTNIIHLLIIKR